PCVYGMLGPLRSWNPVWANLHIYAGMLRDARHTGSALDRLRVLVSRTGWRPADVAARFPVHKVPLAGFRRFDPAFTRGVGMYAALQFLVAVVLALWVQETGNDWPMPPLWAAYGYLLLSLFAIGRLLERGGEGCRAEWIRLLVVALVALWVFMTGVAGPAVAPAACLYLLASGLALRTLR
ncbi:MAG: hypothetical protein ACKO4A_04410, partial [Gammaproteobacteria bacterium]